MLNWAARYYPIVRALRRVVGNTDSILEVGSGAFGLARYLPHNIVGCDVTFAQKPLANLLAVRASALHLPFSDESFAAVVSSDVLEHVPPDLRPQVISETLRVARKVAIFGFPCGLLAQKLDEDFLTFHREHNIDPPEWLTEHMQFPFPQTSLFAQLEPAWRVRFFGNESLRFHALINHAERRGPWNRLFQTGLSLVPTLCERALQLFDRPPFYRQICIIERA